MSSSVWDMASQRHGGDVRRLRVRKNHGHELLLSLLEQPQPQILISNPP